MTIVAILFVWLGVHRYFVVQYDFNPWKSGGMAMYTNKHEFNLDLQFYLDTTLLDLSPSDFSNPARRQVRKFRSYRKQLGKLIHPEKTGQVLLEESYANRVDFIITLERIDPKTSKLSFKREVYRVTQTPPDPEPGR